MMIFMVTNFEIGLLLTFVGSVALVLYLSFRQRKGKTELFLGNDSIRVIATEFGYDNISSFEAMTLKIDERIDQGEHGVIHLNLAVKDFSKVLPLRSFLHVLDEVFHRVQVLTIDSEAIRFLCTFKNELYILKANVYSTPKEHVKSIPSIVLNTNMEKVYQIVKTKDNKLLSCVSNYFTVVCAVNDGFFKPSLLEKRLEETSIEFKVSKLDESRTYYTLEPAPMGNGYIARKRVVENLKERTTGDTKVYYPAVDLILQGREFKGINGDQVMRVIEIGLGHFNMFITGQLGTGKTRLLARIIYHIQKNKTILFNISCAEMMDMIKNTQKMSVIRNIISNNEGNKVVLIIDDAFPLLRDTSTRATITTMMDGVEFGKDLTVILLANNVEGNWQEDLNKDIFRPGRMDMIFQLKPIERQVAGEVMSEIIANAPSDPKHTFAVEEFKNAVNANQSVTLAEAFSYLRQDNILSAITEEIVTQLETTGVQSPFKSSLSPHEDKNPRPATRIVPRPRR